MFRKLKNTIDNFKHLMEVNFSGVIDKQNNYFSNGYFVLSNNLLTKPYEKYLENNHKSTGKDLKKVFKEYMSMYNENKETFKQFNCDMYNSKNITTVYNKDLLLNKYYNRGINEFYYSYFKSKGFNILYSENNSMFFALEKDNIIYGFILPIFIDIALQGSISYSEFLEIERIKEGRKAILKALKQ